MSSLERDSIYRPGAFFFKEGDELMFQFQSDASSKIGPRPATKLDKSQFAGEYEAYLKEAFNGSPLDAFDHDGVDGPGGSHAPIPDPAPKKRGRPPKA